MKDLDRNFRLLFEGYPQPLWILDADTARFVDANQSAADLYGFSIDEFRWMQLSDLQSRQESERFLKQLRAAPQKLASNWRHRTKAGHAIDVELAIHEIEYAGKTAMLAVLVDVTGRRESEERVRQAQKMEAVGMLAGGVAHDFNNLLTIINGYTQLILNTLAPDDRNRHSAEQVMKAGERAAALTNQLLAFSRRQLVQPSVVDLNRAVSDLSVMLKRMIGEDVDLRLQLGPDVGRVSAGPGQAEQVLMNLVVNARDAMPRGGALTIETSNVELDANYAGHQFPVKPGRYVLMAVSDTGAGMDEATRQRLFEPFFTTKGPGKGTGFGLPTVFGIVKQCHGALDVYSEPGHGTSVKAYFPRVDQAEPVPHEARRRMPRGTETILLVEDDEMVRNLVCETLEREGYKIIAAGDPVEAQRRAGAYRGKIQLLITDVVMPRLSGKELAKILLDKRPDLKILYMSGYTDGAIVNSGILQKEVAFLQKPFNPAALAGKVREVLESSKIRHAAE